MKRKDFLVFLVLFCGQMAAVLSSISGVWEEL